MIFHGRREKSKVPVEGLLRPDNFADADEEASTTWSGYVFLVLRMIKGYQVTIRENS